MVELDSKYMKEKAMEYSRTRVNIVADGGSTVKNIYVGGKRVDEEKLAADGWAVEPVAGWLSVLGRALFYAALLVFCALAWGLALKACSSPAHASSGSCEFIKDADDRHYCRACSSGRTGECEFIKNSDKRHKCRALCKSSTR